MGLDAIIYVKSKEEDIDLEWSCGSNYSINAAPAWAKEDYEECTHEIDCGCSRYYGIEYERGPWPIFAGIIMQLLQEPSIEKVWYGHDCGYVSEITAEDVLEITAHYMKVGHRPYRNEKL